jgi:alcohol dehydrogenase class IV
MARIFYLMQIELDNGAIACLPKECEPAGMRRPLLVTDPGVRAAGM